VVARLAARDIGAMNQELCANARVLYVVCDEHDPAQMARLNRLGERILAELQELPPTLSTLAKQVNPELQEHLAGIELQDDFFKVFRAADERAGAIVVSQIDDVVEFSEILSKRHGQPGSRRQRRRGPETDHRGVPDGRGLSRHPQARDPRRPGDPGRAAHRVPRQGDRGGGRRPAGRPSGRTADAAVDPRHGCGLTDGFTAGPGQVVNRGHGKIEWENVHG